MTKAIGKGKVSNPKKPLGKILEKWVKYLGIYSTKLEKDNPFWHNERANLGAFSSAVVKAKGFSLEEYTNEKKMRIGKGGKTKRKSGRVDLFFVHEDIRYVAEAKIYWKNINRFDEKNSKKTGEAVKKQANLKLRKALSQLKKYRHPNFAYRVGILFIVPFFRNKSPKDVNGNLKRFLEWSGKIKQDNSAYFFLTNHLVHKMVSERFSTKKRRKFLTSYYPGVVCVVRIIKKRG